MSNYKHRAGFFFCLLFSLFCSLALTGAFGILPAFAESDEIVLGEETNRAAVSDPYERFNRAVFNANDKLYFWALRPAATAYAAVVPLEFRTSVNNAAKNFESPARVANCILQRKGCRASTEMKRFLINSTLGLGGMYDFAQSEFGISSPQEEDFGLTLAHYGVGAGAFVMLPLLGPSDARDLLGYGVDHTVMDPMFWIPTAVWVDPAVKAGKILNTTSLRLGKYEEFKKSAVDPYVSMREAYMQHRENEIRQ
jgi:phospholipid-binding lipoprotein MlaA